jgi:hypothetical protein
MWIILISLSSCCRLLGEARSSGGASLVSQPGALGPTVFTIPSVMLNIWNNQSRSPGGHPLPATETLVNAGFLPEAGCPDNRLTFRKVSHPYCHWSLSDQMHRIGTGRRGICTHSSAHHFFSFMRSRFFMAMPATNSTPMASPLLLCFVMTSTRPGAPHCPTLPARRPTPHQNRTDTHRHDADHAVAAQAALKQNGDFPGDQFLGITPIA